MLSNTTSRIGLFGGTFNPPHVGHIIIAQYAVEELELDLLYVIPTYKPWHKSEMLAPFETRFNWCKVCFENEKIKISDFEKVRGETSYSIYVIEHFANLHQTKPFFIVGEDCLSYIEKWYRYNELFEKSHFVVYPRYCNRPYEQHAKTALGKLYETIIFLNAPLVQISSTEIRERIKKNKSIKGMVHPQIEKEVIDYFKQF
nr:nicotinate (nicotinamide) nucleotide adenylyltransferase [Pseudothermotoga thermarum]